MKLLHLKYFVEIADCRSLTRAAERLYISQPYLSRVVAETEARLNKKLFIRSSRGLELTPWGHKAYLLAQSILHQMELLEKLGKTPEKENFSANVSVCTGNLFLGECLLPAYLSRTTAADIHFSLRECTITECIECTEKGFCDFSLIVADDRQQKLISHLLKKKRLDYRELDRGSLCWHLHRGHPLASLKTLTPENLADYPLVRFREDPLSILTSEALRKEYPLIRPDRCITVNHYSSCLSLIRHSGALMLGNQWQKAQLEKSGIKSIGFSFLPHKAHLSLIKNPHFPLSREAETFLHLFQNLYSVNSEEI